MRKLYLIIIAYIIGLLLILSAFGCSHKTAAPMATAYLTTQSFGKRNELDTSMLRFHQREVFQEKIRDTLYILRDSTGHVNQVTRVFYRNGSCTNNNSMTATRHAVKYDTITTLKEATIPSATTNNTPNKRRYNYYLAFIALVVLLTLAVIAKRKLTP